MRRSVLLILVLFAAASAAHSDGRCPPREVRVLLDKTGVTAGAEGTIYHVRYSAVPCCNSTDWFYMENGVLPGVQTGSNHVLLGSVWGHDHRCYWPVEAERDHLLY